jgi:hypothetical protein
MSPRPHIIQPIPPLPVSRRGMKQIAVSAVCYLALCVWLGPTVAFWLTLIGSWTLFWFWLCSRFPVLGAFTSAFLVGFIGGLFNYRNGYAFRSRYRRRRR